MTFRAVVLSGLLAAPLGAMADTPEESQNACFEASSMMGQMLPCVSDAVRVCLEDIPGYDQKGVRPEQMLGCVAPVAAWWERKADAEYERVLGVALVQDGEAGGATPVTSRVARLKTLQAAWLAYRDARCAVDMVGTGPGAESPLAAVSCLMNESAEHAVYLSAWGKPRPF